jgi:hypothetical protein
MNVDLYRGVARRYLASVKAIRITAAVPSLPVCLPSASPFNPSRAARPLKEQAQTPTTPSSPERG